jgi:hypothetical protein
MSAKPGSEGGGSDLDARVLHILSALGTSVDPSDLPALGSEVAAELDRAGDLTEAFR